MLATFNFVISTNDYPFLFLMTSDACMVFFHHFNPTIAKIKNTNLKIKHGLFKAKWRKYDTNLSGCLVSKKLATMDGASFPYTCMVVEKLWKVFAKTVGQMWMLFDIHSDYRWTSTIVEYTPSENYSIIPGRLYKK